MKLLIIIPAYNEEKSIANVINQIKQESLEYDYVVINDGSTDNTLEILQSNLINHLNLPINLGLSGAFCCGIKYAFDNDYDCVVQIDADGQHDSKYIKDMLKEMESSNCNVVIGSRFCEKRAPYSTLRGFGSHIVTALIKLRTHKTITDPTSGMRMYDRKVIELFANNNFMEPEPHTMAYLLKNGYTINEVSVIMREREAGESYLQGLKVARYMINVCLSILLV